MSYVAEHPVYRVSEFQKPFYNPGEAARIMGVSLQSIHKYDKDGKLKTYRSEGGHRRIKREDLIAFLDRKGLILDDTKQVKRDVIYARVSSYKQKAKGDLDHQAMYLVEHVPDLQNPLILKEVGSGLNDRRAQLLELIRMVMDGGVNNVYITDEDRLTRFGYHYLETVFLSKGVNIIVVRDDQGSKSVEQELVDDMTALIASFSGKLYGMRQERTRKRRCEKMEIHNLEDLRKAVDETNIRRIMTEYLMELTAKADLFGEVKKRTARGESLDGIEGL